jgi:hypothetical protein
MLDNVTVAFVIYLPTLSSFLLSTPPISCPSADCGIFFRLIHCNRLKTSACNAFITYFLGYIHDGCEQCMLYKSLSNSYILF